MEQYHIICYNCESEIVIEVVHSDKDVTFCSQCGDTLTYESEE